MKRITTMITRISVIEALTIDILLLVHAPIGQCSQAMMAPLLQNGSCEIFSLCNRFTTVRCVLQRCYQSRIYSSTLTVSKKRGLMKGKKVDDNS